MQDIQRYIFFSCFTVSRSVHTENISPRLFSAVRTQRATFMCLSFTFHNRHYYIYLSKCIEQDCVKVLVKYAKYSKLYAFFFRHLRSSAKEKKIATLYKPQHLRNLKRQLPCRPFVSSSFSSCGNIP